MKFSLAFLASLISLVQLCSANFDIYSVEEASGRDNVYFWQVFNSDPSCNDVLKGARSYLYLSNVSQNEGFRCKGTCSREERADGILELEMRFKSNPLYHWTIYKDRGYQMYGLDGKVYGQCVPFPNNNFNCPGFGAVVAGRRKFRCTTNFTARQIGWT